METIFQIAIFLFFLALGFFVGTYVEKKHYADIKRREMDSVNIAVVTSKKMVECDDITDAVLLTGSVVISLDYFKRILAGLRNFFGGRVGSYETLLDRGRREAILRLKERARELGYDTIINLRLENSTISNVTSKEASLGCFEVLAYGTALKTNHGQVHPQTS